MSQITAMNKRIISYSIGFITSVSLTVLAYVLATGHVIKDAWTPAIFALVLSLLAVVQLIVQLIFFLHLGSEPKPRWKLVSFIFAFIILGIIVFGSLWIMFDLNSRMMTSPTDMIKYMNRQTGV